VHQPDLERLLGSTPLIDTLSAEGTFVSVDTRQADLLGLPAPSLVGQDWANHYTIESRDRIAGQFTGALANPNVIVVELKSADHGILRFAAITEAVEDPVHGLCLRLYKWLHGSALYDLAALYEKNEVLSGIVATSDDAGWCMEWVDPVDLSAPEHEIIRQVFENGPRWRYCNEAMARLYRAPEDADFNTLPVHETFPRSAENEEFVSRLIRADFNVNRSPSRDLRYDGVYIDVENDVRGHIRGNKLYRMWGTVRDVGKHLHRETLLLREIELLDGILKALPEPVLVIDRSISLLYANPAAEALFSLPPETLAQRSLDELLSFGETVDSLFQQTPPTGTGNVPITIEGAVRRPEGRAPADLSASVFSLRGADCLVLTIRLAHQTSRRRQGNHAVGAR